MRLYDYWRSSAAYRVRIALNFKGLTYEQVAVDLRAGAQRTPEFLEINPQGLVPVLEDDGVRLTQSLPILNYLEERYPEPALLPKDAAGRATSRAIGVAIACEIHPLNNLRVLQYLERATRAGRGRSVWSGITIGWPKALARSRRCSPVPPGRSASAIRQASPTYAWCRRCTTPGATSAISRPTRRSARIDERCRQIVAFAKAAPERQPDAVT